MTYAKDDYIYGVSDKSMDEESQKVYDLLKNKPNAPIGYAYKLKTDLTWELFKIPESQETPTDEATETDYINALEELGVNFNE